MFKKEKITENNVSQGFHTVRDSEIVIGIIDGLFRDDNLKSHSNSLTCSTRFTWQLFYYKEQEILTKEFVMSVICQCLSCSVELNVLFTNQLKDIHQ